MSAPSKAEALCELARVARQEGRVGEAVAFFDQAIAADEHCLPAWEGNAHAAFASKDYSRAIECFRKVSTLDVRRSQPLTNMGAVYNRLGDFQNATKALRQAISRDRKSAEAYYNLGIAHKGLHQLSLAVSAYREAIKFNAAMHDAHQNLANVYAEMGSHALARQHYQKALEIKPDFEPARRGIQRVEEATRASKEKMSPFGRLVDTENLENKSVSSTFRALNSQERFEDRQEKHRLATAAAATAATITKGLAESLQPSLQHLVGLINDRNDRQSLLREHETLRRAHHQLVSDLQALQGVMEELRQHEAFIRKA